VHGLTFGSSSLSSMKELDFSGDPRVLGDDFGGEAHLSSIKQLLDAVARWKGAQFPWPERPRAPLPRRT
jgi:hypothetical protein